MERLSALLVSLCRPITQDLKASDSTDDDAEDHLLNLVNLVGAEALCKAHEQGSMEHLRLFARMLRTPAGRSLLRYSLQADFSGVYVRDVQQELPQLAIFTDFADMQSVPEGREPRSVPAVGRPAVAWPATTPTARSSSIACSLLGHAQAVSGRGGFRCRHARAGRRPPAPAGPGVRLVRPGRDRAVCHGAPGVRLAAGHAERLLVVHAAVALQPHSR